METREKLGEIPPLKLDVPTLSGLGVFNDVIIDAMSKASLGGRLVVPEKELEFFSVVDRYLDRYEVDFSALDGARAIIESNLPDLKSYGVEREAATRLDEKGVFKGSFYGLIIYGRVSGAYEGDIGGTVSSLSRLELPDEDQRGYVSLLSGTINELNEPLSRATNFNFRVGKEDEFNRILLYLNDHLSKGKSIDIGMVNEIDNRLVNFSTLLRSVSGFQKFDGFDGLSQQEGGRKRRYAVLNDYFSKISKRVVPNKWGVLYGGLKFGVPLTATGVLLGLYSKDMSLVFVSGIAGPVYTAVICAFLEPTYVKSEPYEALKKRLGMPINEYTKGAIEQVM